MGREDCGIKDSRELDWISFNWIQKTFSLRIETRAIVTRRAYMKACYQKNQKQ
jgi:hypothetical protein